MINMGIKNRIIALAGREQSGKSTLADYLVAKYEMSRRHIKQPMMDMAAALLRHLGITDEREIFERLDGARKNEDIPGWPGLTGRHILRVVGNETNNALSPGGKLFLKIWIDSQKDAKLIINESVRFPVEREFLKPNDACVIWIKRNTGIPADLKYEPRIKSDIMIYNEGTIEQLFSAAEEAIRTTVPDGTTRIYRPGFMPFELPIEEATLLQ